MKFTALNLVHYLMHLDEMGVDLEKMELYTCYKTDGKDMISAFKCIGIQSNANALAFDCGFEKALESLGVADVLGTTQFN